MTTAVYRSHADKVTHRSAPTVHSPHAQHHRNSMVSHRHRDSRVPSMQKYAKVEQCAPSPPSRLPPPSSSSPSLEDSSSSESSHVACTTSLALEAPHLGCGWADSASGGLGGGRKGGRKGRDGSSRGLFLHARPVWRTHTTSLSMPHPSWCHHGPGQYPCAPAWTSTR